MRDIFRKLYTQQKSNAKQRGVEFRLTLEEWKQLWLDSGKWEQRGRGADKYCMCRIGDSGAYEVGNVFIGLGKQNVSDGNIGKQDSDETRAKKSAALSGKSKEYMLGDNNPMRNEASKRKVLDQMSGAKHYMAKVTMTPFGFFKTATEAANALGIPKPTVNWRCKHNTPGWAYI